MAVSEDDRLPPLTSMGWGAVLASGLLILVLAFSPLVVRPTVMKHLHPEHVTPTVTIMLSPLFPVAFAIVALVALALAMNKGRNNYAYASLGIALAGTALMIAGIYGAVR
jgi:hypothetical protein